MLIIKLKGGLGNQMFQYATGLALAIINKTEFLLDISSYSDPRAINSDTPRTFDLDHFNISAPIANAEQIKKVKYPLGPLSKILNAFNKKILRKHYLDYDPDLFAKILIELKKDKNIYLDGFFQSEKNFASFRPTILREFTLQNKFLTNYIINLEQKMKSTNSVSIHIRRGDYAYNFEAQNHHGLCPLEYYQRAIMLISDKINDPHFYIFTDDLGWVKENLKINYNQTFISDKNFSPQQELYLMSKCQNNIIANSSFSWWGAWLNQNPNKTVIAPKQWTVKNTEHPNILPEEWIKI